jgi:subtilisin family serine protease
MSERLGPLLANAIDRMTHALTPERQHFIAAAIGSEDPNPQKLPIVIQLARCPPRPQEPWDGYANRVAESMQNLRGVLEGPMGAQATPLISGNALKASLDPDQIRHLSGRHDIRLVELDPFVMAACLDDVPGDIDITGFGRNYQGIDGTGVTVAVLDSGIDTKHPYLNVVSSITTCSESVDRPGDHGTHCAGIIASKDTVYRGVSPGVSLMNVKVLRANGSGQHTDITQGIDEALKGGAQVLSMSLGFNHLPTWSNGGHGWACPLGNCTLCTAVDNASDMGAVVVVAAGNEHERAEALRTYNYNNTFDTELGCPGQARNALTVGAVTKRTFLPASFSSHGPTADKRSKPDLCAAGVNITSTIPVPRDVHGNPVPNASRSTLFGRMSGTSMATPIVAASAALLIGVQRARGASWTVAQIRRELTSRGIAPIPGVSANLVGAGRIFLSGL